MDLFTDASHHTQKTMSMVKKHIYLYIYIHTYVCIYLYQGKKKPWMDFPSFGGPSLGGIGAPETGKHAWIHGSKTGE